MTHVKKMLLVPSHAMAPTLLQTPLNPSSTETPEKALTRRSINELDTEMEHILQNDGLSEGEKLKLLADTTEAPNLPGPTGNTYARADKV